MHTDEAGDRQNLVAASNTFRIHRVPIEAHSIAARLDLLVLDHFRLAARFYSRRLVTAARSDTLTT